LIFRKNFFLVIIFFLFGVTNVWSSEKIAFLDVEFIINKSEPALLIIKKIEKIRDQETKKLNQIENNLKKKNEDLIKTKNLISDEELKKKISSLRDEAKSFDELRKKTITELNIKKNKELNKFLKLINPIIQEYMKEKSIDMIIDKKNIFMAKSKNDITEDILKIVNTKIK
jgi:Skp family chaperone for outer membrane proteins